MTTYSLVAPTIYPTVEDAIKGCKDYLMQELGCKEIVKDLFLRIRDRGVFAYNLFHICAILKQEEGGYRPTHRAAQEYPNEKCYRCDGCDRIWTEEYEAIKLMYKLNGVKDNPIEILEN